MGSFCQKWGIRSSFVLSLSPSSKDRELAKLRQFAERPLSPRRRSPFVTVEAPDRLNIWWRHTRHQDLEQRLLRTADPDEFQLGSRGHSCQIEFGSRRGVPNKLKRKLSDVRCHGRCAVNRDRKPVAPRVAAGTSLALLGDRSCAPGGVSSIGCDLLR
jgi:hypothetical protein